MGDWVHEQGTVAEISGPSDSERRAVDNVVMKRLKTIEVNKENENHTSAPLSVITDEKWPAAIIWAEEEKLTDSVVAIVEADRSNVVTIRQPRTTSSVSDAGNWLSIEMFWWTANVRNS